MAVKINNISYSGFFYNGEALTAMYLNGNKVFSKSVIPPIKYKTYRQVEWVSNENISTRIWLDLGYVWKNNSRAQLGFVIPGTHQKPNGQQVFGEDTVWASDGNGPVNDNDDLRLFFTKSSSNIGAYWDVATSRIQATIGAITDVWQDWEIGNNYIKNLSNNTNFATGSTYNISRIGTVGLYGACQYLNTGRTDCVRYSYVKIYEDDELIMDIVPVLDENDIPMFLDKISGKEFAYMVDGHPSTGLTAGRVYGDIIPQYEPIIISNLRAVRISNDNIGSVAIGKTKNLNASTEPNTTLTYTSSNPSVASVDSNGVISGVAEGSATITITAQGYYDKENEIIYQTTAKQLEVECNNNTNSVEVLSTEVIDSSYDDNRHVTMNSSHANGSYYMFIIEASGNFTYTYNKKPEGSGNGVLQFESLMSEDFYTENPQGYDTAIDQYWSENYNGNYDDPNAAQITVTGLPKGKYMLRFFAPTYNLKVLGKWYTLRRAMHGFFTIS